MSGFTYKLLLRHSLLVFRIVRQRDRHKDRQAGRRTHTHTLRAMEFYIRKYERIGNRRAYRQKYKDALCFPHHSVPLTCTRTLTRRGSLRNRPARMYVFTYLTTLALSQARMVELLVNDKQERTCKKQSFSK